MSSAKSAFQNILKKWIARRRERIYILPTRFGLLYLASISIMIMVGAAYSNNLVNLLSYFLLAIVLVSMIQTHTNLLDLKIVSLFMEPGPSGGEMDLLITLENGSNTTKFALKLTVPKIPSPAEQLPYSEADIISPLNQTRLQLKLKAPMRGVYRLNRIELSTVYPFGLFRAWKPVKCDLRYWVYPKAAALLSAPRHRSSDDAEQIFSLMAQGEDFRGHRRAQTGDSHRRMDWKAFARGRPLLTKEFDGGGKPLALFHWEDTESLQDVENRLSQLEAWLENSFQNKMPFTLIMPQQTLGPNQGLGHLRRCQEALSIFAKTDSIEVNPWWKKW